MDSDDYMYDDSGNSSDEDEDFAMEPSSEATCSKEMAEEGDSDDFEFKVLNPDQIMSFMTESIEEVNNVLQLPQTTTRMLLQHFKWDKEKLMDRFYDGDQEKMFKEAHVVSPFKKPRTHPIKKELSKGGVELEECEICMMSKPSNMMANADCGHRFCCSCWSEYLSVKIVSEGVSQTVLCPATTCNIFLDDKTVLKLVTEPKVRVKYQHLITNSFVECNRLLRWCPGPGCNNAVRAHHPECRPVMCTCGEVFCFMCGQNWHDPVKCSLLRRWIRKCDDDSETSNWIAANTKECPKCSATIEKDGGCNHMICKNMHCKYEFCWICLGPWEPHGSSWYSCNRFDEDDAKSARTAQEQHRSSLQRYLFYCNRYMNHMQSLKLEHKLYSAVKDKMEEMQQHNMSWIEVQFLKKAVDILCQCRQTLMFTYVFAYYLKKNNQSVIFEENQKDLESATETLSEYLERDITSDNLIDIKQKVQDKIRYCDHRRKVLTQHVHEGYDNDWWDYTEKVQ
ncbi:E3 ubiquitin-protein ligase ariadne-1-like [Artemia franciscana]|uniref:RBR-type E3 ubiquitin transferase n=1 Tax=Artemia franciscana TaxID=6661 RepID=A0AA88HBJ8_ARTSF|nr:hypothetical protein QYM36_017653 [Artemia franciscana]